MFTEGLDESAINWIKQGSESQQQEQSRGIRSPLSPLSPVEHDPFPKSPLLKNPLQKSSVLYNSNSFSSAHLLPPLKFHSGLLTPHSLVAPRLDNDNVSGNGSDNESVASVSDCFGRHYYEEEDEEEDADELFVKRPHRKLNRGILKEDLRIDVPDSNFRRFTTDGDVGFRKDLLQGFMPGSCPLRERVQLHNANMAFDGGSSKFKEVGDMGTPSAPPIMETGGEEKSFVVELQIEETGVGIDMSGEGNTFDGSREGLDRTSHSMPSTDFVESVNHTMSRGAEEKLPYWQTSSLDHSSYYNTRGCTEAPEFLRDECLLLRIAFGLHKYLLQPQGVQAVESTTTKNTEQSSQMKVKKVVGKIRVEVKTIRIIPRRRLKSTSSQRSAIYMEVGKEYVRHVSSLVKTGMNSLKIASFPVTPEEQLSCSFQLKSTSDDDSQVGPGSTICLHPGSGEYHVFFPESEGDALLVEVQDAKKSV